LLKQWLFFKHEKELKQQMAEEKKQKKQLAKKK
jgi:hypothetical protein